MIGTQGLFRNPLVSPDILGVSTGAGLGAAAGIFLSLPVIAIQGMAFVTGLATVALVYAVATAVRGQLNSIPPGDSGRVPSWSHSKDRAVPQPRRPGRDDRTR